MRVVFKSLIEVEGRGILKDRERPQVAGLGSLTGAIFKKSPSPREKTELGGR